MICIFCFYNVSSGIQAKLSFSKQFKHCNLITYDGSVWMAHEFDKEGFHFRTLNVFSSSSLLRGLRIIDSLTALIGVEVKEKASIRWKPYLVRSCNEIDRYISGIDIGFTFNPKHLYNKLLYSNSAKFDVLYDWRR